MPNRFEVTQAQLNFKSVEAQIIAALKKGMGRAVTQLVHDANVELLATPLDTGHLRSSASAFVDGDLIMTTEGQYTQRIEDGKGAGTPSTTLEEDIAPLKIVGVVGFNTPYAAFQHEGGDGKRVVKNYTTQGTGKKFLERKLQERDELYVQIIGNAVKEAGNA